MSDFNRSGCSTIYIQGFLYCNAGIERLFSLVNKNKNESSERNRLDIKGSLSSILTVKLERPESQEKCNLDKTDK